MPRKAEPSGKIVVNAEPSQFFEMLDQVNPGSRRQILLAIDRIAKRRREAKAAALREADSAHG